MSNAAEAIKKYLEAVIELSRSDIELYYPQHMSSQRKEILEADIKLAEKFLKSIETHKDELPFDHWSMFVQFIMHNDKRLGGEFDD